MNIARLEGRLVVVSEVVGVSAYDFDFDLNFRCEHPFQFQREEPCVLRVGAIDKYEMRFAEMQEIGLRPVNSPDEHQRASELERWYPLISELTPRSIVFEALPPATEIEAAFAWPVFIKGSRQTSKHSAALSIASDREDYDRIRHEYQRDEILHWQKPVVREFVPLMKADGVVPGQVSPSIEFRSFWWRGECVGWGQYWYQLPSYQAADIQLGLDMAHEAVRRLNVPFVVIDIAKTADGRWIVIECNDAQESGYTGVPAKRLWERILALC
ncbi:MAG: ATP-grasp domain-containing protein [Hyphomonadaceae bacterium]